MENFITYLFLYAYNDYSFKNLLAAFVFVLKYELFERGVACHVEISKFKIF